MKKLKLLFKEDGTVEVDASGFSGNECIEQTEKLLKDLNPEQVSQVIKGEYHVHEKTKNRTTVQG